MDVVRTNPQPVDIRVAALSVSVGTGPTNPHRGAGDRSFTPCSGGSLSLDDSRPATR